MTTPACPRSVDEATFRSALHGPVADLHARERRASSTLRWFPSNPNPRGDMATWKTHWAYTVARQIRTRRIRRAYPTRWKRGAR